MDTKTSWTWQSPYVSSFMTHYRGLIMYSDGGFRPNVSLAAAGWVIVAICDTERTHASDICSPIHSIKNLESHNSSDLRAVKIAEGARFLPDCRSSFEAELIAVSELMLHVDSLAVVWSSTQLSADSPM